MRLPAFCPAWKSLPQRRASDPRSLLLNTGGRTDGILAQGTITAADLVGPLDGQTLDDLLEEMRAGDTYVNAHTSEFPGGEIRGQIEARGLFGKATYRAHDGPTFREGRRLLA